MKIPAYRHFARFRMILLLGSLAMTSIAQAAPQPFTESEAAAIDVFLQNGFTDKDFGFVIGLIDDNGSRVFGAGHADNGTNEEVNGDTVFEIGSVTKTFTSLLLLDMVQRSELKLDDPAAKYLPDGVTVPAYDGTEISLFNLAAQDSGLPFNADNMLDADLLTAYNAYGAQDMYAFLAGFALTAAPGTRFEYSNLGMSLLGHVMERRAGMSYEALVVSRILDVLGMDDTRITLTADQQRRRAVGHDMAGDRTSYYALKVMQAAGSLNSTANDMLKYLSAQLGFTTTPLDPLIRQTHVVLHQGATQYGDTALPWVDGGVYQPEGSEFLGHAGGTPGFSAFVGFDAGRRRGVVALTNQRIQDESGRLWPSAAVGWTILQGLPLTSANVSRPVLEMVGLGVSLASDETSGLLRISGVFADSPAGRAGLQAGLLIRRINGTTTENKTIAECIALMGGPAGTPVELELAGPAPEEMSTVVLRKAKFLTTG